MPRPLLAPDRVALLLSLVPYLREHGPTPVLELAEAFDTTPELLRRLVMFLATAGVPGETLSYQHEDLFDIDWDAFERDDVVSLTRIVAVDDTPRFAPVETAALIAGLQSLSSVLPEEQAELARATAEKLGAALRDPEATSPLTVSREPDNPQLQTLVAALQSERAVAFEYRSVTGERSRRTVDPLSLYQSGGSWYLRAYCRDREEERTFRVEQMRGAREAGPGRHAPATDGPAARSEQEHELIAVVPEDRLALIAGFAPETIEQLSDGRVRVRIDAWHRGSAVRLVQESRGSAVVESPAGAREAVREWARRGLATYDAEGADSGGASRRPGLH